MMKVAPAALAGMVQMHLQETLAKALEGMEPEPAKITLSVRLDPLVPGGWAISAVGQPMDRPNMAEDAQKRADWLNSGDTGTSSLTIFATMTGNSQPVRYGFGNWPQDASDLGRCVRLLDRFPEWRARMGEMAARYPKWRPFAEAWADLEALYKEESQSPTGRAPKTYALLQGLSAQAEAEG
jgi:hypothetical protein